MTSRERLDKLVALGLELNKVNYAFNRAAKAGRLKGAKALSRARRDIMDQRHALLASATLDVQAALSTLSERTWP